MKSKIKRMIVIALATTMLFGSALTVNAASHPGGSSPSCAWTQVTTGTCSVCYEPCSVYKCTVHGGYMFKPCNHYT